MNLKLRMVLVGCLLSGCTLSSAIAAEPYREFLQKLQESGYGEMSLEYIDQLAARADIPVDFKQTLDLERSKSLRIAAGEAYNAEQRAQRLADADKLLTEFLKNNPKHSAAIPALLSVADDLLRKAQISLGQSRATRDAAEQDKYRKQAREQFTEALAQFVSIQTRLLTRAKELGPLPMGQTPSAERQDLDLAMLETRLNTALGEYLSAETYTDPKDAQRKKHLQNAVKGFDTVFQQNRGTRAGMIGHLWHGKALEELGDVSTAMEIYDEVLVATPEDNAPEADAAIFAQAQLFRMRLLAKTAKPNEILQEGEEWLRTHRFWEKTAPFQGIAMEVARLRLAAALRISGNDQKRHLRDVMALLLAISKVDSEYKNEALLLRRETQEKLGAGAGNVSADEEIALGDSAVAAKEWQEALGCYERAVELAVKAKDVKKHEVATQRLTQVRYQLAIELYNEKKYEEALKAAGAIVRDPKDPTAVAASGLAVACALDMYAAAKEEERPAALERLEKVATFTIDKWPDKAEADDARMALARAQLLKGEEDVALELLDKVNPRSKRYGTGRQVSGQIYWRRYLLAKRASAQDPTQTEKLPALRTEARTRLKESYLALKEEAGTDEKAKEAVADAQLLLAEVTLEDNAPKDAAPLFDELIEQIKKSKPESIDTVIIKTFIGAVRSNLAAGDVDAAGEKALAFVEMSEDTEQINAVLVDFAKIIAIEVQKCEAEIARCENLSPPDPAKMQAAVQASDATKKVLGSLIEKLAMRKSHALISMIFLGDTSAKLKLNQQARDIYAVVLAKIDKKETGSDAEVAAKAATRIRSQLVSILRNENKYDEANKQVDALIKAHPNALEPLMEKGRILQSWAEKDPKRYDECVAHWTNIRVRLGRLKSKPPEYYEVLYNAAFCLLQQAKATKDPSKALQAEQMLKSTLTLTPKLNGPDMVVKYETLLQRATAARGDVGTNKAATDIKKAADKK